MAQRQSLSPLRRALPLLLTTLLAVVNPVSASVVTRLSDQQLVDRSHLIVTGRVTGIETLRAGSDPRRFTYITVQIVETLGGPGPGAELVLKQPGGAGPENTRWIFGSPEFTKGEEVLLALRARPDGSLYTTGLFQGKFSLRQEARGRRAIRDFSHAGTMVLGGKLFQALHEDRDFATLRSRLRQLVRQRGGLQLRQIRTRPAEYADAAASGKTRSSEAFSLVGGKWPAEAFPVVMDFSVNKQPGVSSGGLNQTIAGMAAWNAISGSYAALAPGGFVPARSIFACDLFSQVNFGDPLDEIPNDGTLALGGACAVGTDYVDGDITFNADFSSQSVFSQAGCFQGAATHELGHVLGLGHSSSTSALMYPGISNQLCSNPYPRSDDIAGVTALYPNVSTPSLPAPGPPSNLSAEVAGDQLTLSFSEVSDATSYYVVAVGYCDPCGEIFGSPLFVAGLPSGVFPIALRSVNSGGVSALSEVVEINVGGVKPVPGTLLPPTQFKVEVNGFQISLSWNAVPGATAYDIVAVDICDPCGTVAVTDISGEVPFGSYTLGIRARNGTQVSNLSNMVTFVVTGF
ncbi:MAG: matrixin family metalloprotease [Gammaproteobacteria bacterium]|jgi:hypothetical protein|nr:matrixin family metalloprotease [Gammaproteobacteria bacterium]